jgi:hypothetical protein
MGQEKFPRPQGRLQTATRITAHSRAQRACPSIGASQRYNDRSVADNQSIAPDMRPHAPAKPPIQPLLMSKTDSVRYVADIARKKRDKPASLYCQIACTIECRFDPTFKMLDLHAATD